MLVIVPSRGRPASFDRLVGVFKEAKVADLLVCQDDNDTPYTQPGIENVTIIHGPRKSFAAWLNFSIALPWVQEYPFVGTFGDDHCPQTPGWDETIVNTLKEMGPGSMVYGNDLFQCERIATTVFMTSDIPKAIGYFAVPGFYQYCDPGWHAMGIGAGALRYLPDVIIEHLHPVAGKAPDDQTYRDSTAYYQSDMGVMEHYRATQLQADIEKVKALRS